MVLYISEYYGIPTVRVK